MTCSTLRPCLRTGLVLTLCTATALPAAEATRPAVAVPTPGEVVELSPFTVSTEKDTGYFAENTLAGSRLNTSLRDTASSISVFTREFLDDLAITDLSELLQYSVNGEIDTAANRSNVEQNPFVNAERLTARVLIRGLAASEGMDYFTSITPSDPYRVGRFEDSRGPNSIIYGIGSPGGLVNQSSKIAHLRRDEASLRYSFGSWDRHRSEVDVNKILVKQKVALSLAALDQENGGWRAFDFQRTSIGTGHFWKWALPAVQKGQASESGVQGTGACPGVVPIGTGRFGKPGLVRAVGAFAGHRRD